ncbi:hypothetical protein Trydic_g8674 [Trypoxylus dichotomus]
MKNDEQILSFIFGLAEDQIPLISNAITRRFLPNFNVKYSSVNQYKYVFKKTNVNWMANDFAHGDADDTDFLFCSVSKFGREAKEFEDSGEKRERSKIPQALINATFSSQSADHTKVFSAVVALTIFIQA